MHGKISATMMIPVTMMSIPWMAVSQNIVVSKSCAADDANDASEAVQFSLKVYDVEKICPKADYGVLHTQACEDCASKTSEALEGEFVFCYGCNLGAEADSCSDVINYAKSNAVVVKAEKAGRRLQQASGNADMDSTHTREVPRALQSFDASCNINNAGASSQIDPFNDVRYDCNPCIGVPLLVDACCHDCYQKVQRAIGSRTFVSCVGCEGARSGQESALDADKAAQYSDRTSDMDQYLKEAITASSSSGNGQTYCDATDRAAGAGTTVSIVSISIVLLTLLV